MLALSGRPKSSPLRQSVISLESHKSTQLFLYAFSEKLITCWLLRRRRVGAEPYPSLQNTEFTRFGIGLSREIKATATFTHDSGLPATRTTTKWFLNVPIPLAMPRSAISATAGFFNLRYVVSIRARLILPGKFPDPRLERGKFPISGCVASAPP